MVDVSVEKYNIYSLGKEYSRYTTHILNFQLHINSCFKKNIIDINNRNNYLQNLNDMLHSLNTIYDIKLKEYTNNKKDNNRQISDIINIPYNINMYDDVEHLVKYCKMLTTDSKNKNTLLEVFEDQFLEINYKFVKFGEKVGFYNLHNAFEILIGEQYRKIFDNKTNKIIDICNEIYIPLKCTSKNYNKCKEKYYAKKIKPINEVLINNCAEIKIKNRITDEYIVFVGYFVNDSLNIVYSTSKVDTNLLYLKKKSIEDKLEKKTNINKRFKNTYIKNSTLSDFIIYTSDQFILQLEKDYIKHNKLSKLRFIDLMKEFVTDVAGILNIQNMYDIIRLLLLGTKENIDVASLLFDVTKDRKNKNETISNIIYQNLRYASQIKLKKTSSDIKTELERIKTISFDDINLETQIALCKNIPDYAKKAAMVKIEEMKSSNNEYSKQLQYVKTLINYPWPSEEEDRMFVDIGKDKERSKNYITSINNKLNKKLYGHKLCKNTICEIVSKWLSNPHAPGCSFGLVGPPGVGKTLIAKAIGDCLDIPFIQITLGGQNDGEYLHGHGYTYSGAKPGVIINEMVKAGSSRSIIYFDELDKTCKKIDNNEIFNILIHMTDPNTNDEFTDRFFQEIKFSLRNVIFIFSYNSSELIDPILLDRIDEIEIKPYSIKDKINISRDFLMKELCKDIGFSENSVVFSDKCLEYMINNYTNEAGVRSLNRQINKILLKMNKDRIFDEGSFKDKQIYTESSPLLITKDILEYYLDKPANKPRKIHADDSIGIINGMYATQTGSGGVLPIQIYPNLTYSDDKFKLVFTGKQLDDMKDSIITALTPAVHIIKKELRNAYFATNKNGFHIHTPSASVPKDGPSAGCAFAIGLISVILNKKIKHDIAITGEIESDGKIAAIGGLRYKLTGAKKAGIKLALVPHANMEDIENIMKEDSNLIDGVILQIKYIKYLKDAIKDAFVDYDELQFV
jgi:endopeptidase La